MLTVQSGLFQSTHPVRGATEITWFDASEIVISIHAPREGCDVILTGCKLCRGISIHAPREGCDERYGRIRVQRTISIHAPREGCDPISVLMLAGRLVFQSTHPVRGATRNHAIF